MPIDELLVDRMKNIFELLQVDYTEKKMFGGNCFMVDNKMLIAALGMGLLARVGPTEIEELVKRPGASQMLQNGRKMTGYALVEHEGYDSDSELEFWIIKCLEYNPIAKASKKKKKK